MHDNIFKSNFNFNVKGLYIDIIFIIVYKNYCIYYYCILIYYYISVF